MLATRIVSLLALAAATGSALGAPVTAGDIVVYRVGDGTGSLVNTGSAVFIDEYTPGGTLVQSLAMPSNSAGTNLIASGTATSEGLLTVSPGGRYVTITGYNRAVGGTGSINSTAAATVNRTVGVIDTITGNTNFTTLTDYADGNNARSAVTTNGTDLWVAGAAGGVRYTTVGSTTSTQLSTTVANIRQVNVFGGQLFVSDSSGTAVRLGAVGAGTPTASGQTITNLPGFATSTGSPYSFFFADLSSSVPGLDTLFVADDSTTGGGILKFSLVGGNWVANGSVGASADAYRGLTGVVNGSSVTLFATRKGGSAAAGGGELVSLTDASGYNAAISGTPTLLATAGTNEAFRGVGFIVPVPGTAALIGLGGLLAMGRRRS